MKKLFLFLMTSLLLLAQDVNYSILKFNNRILLNITQKVTDNKEWMDKFFRLSTYTYHDYSRIFTSFNVVLEAENVLLNRYIPIKSKNLNSNETKELISLSKQIEKYLNKSPDKLKNVYYLLYYYKKLIRIHNLYLDRYKDLNDYTFNQIYLTKYPEAQKYKFLQTAHLYYYFNYLETENDKTFNKFIKDLKENTYWFLRYFGKSVKFADEIPNNDL